MGYYKQGTPIWIFGLVCTYQGVHETSGEHVIRAPQGGVILADSDCDLKITPPKDELRALLFGEEGINTNTATYEELANYYFKEH